MRYEIFKDNIKLSKLGLGAMRFPQTEPGFAGPIDEPKAQEVIDYCMAHGVNYYDTAYIYHGGKSEVVSKRLSLRASAATDTSKPPSSPLLTDTAGGDDSSK